MPILGVVASSNSTLYQLAQTYTTTSTYTVPNGVYQIAGIAVGTGGTGWEGESASSSYGGSGGGGGGGGSIIGFWNQLVSPGQVWTCSINSSGTTIAANFNANLFVSASKGSNAAGISGGAGAGTTKGSSPITFAAAAGGTGGNGAAQRTTNGNGFNGLSPIDGSLWVPTEPGLPTNLKSGSGGGGGGGGAKATNIQFFGGGTGASTVYGSSGGRGGNAYQDFDINGVSGTTSSVVGVGGGGGGGGAWQTNIGAGFGGGGVSGTTGIIYIYER